MTNVGNGIGNDGGSYATGSTMSVSLFSGIGNDGGSYANQSTLGAVLFSGIGNDGGSYATQPVLSTDSTSKGNEFTNETVSAIINSSGSVGGTPATQMTTQDSSQITSIHFETSGGGSGTFIPVYPDGGLSG